VHIDLVLTKTEPRPDSVQGYSFGALAASVYSPSLDLLNQLRQTRPNTTLSVRHIIVSPPVGMTAVFLIPLKYGSYTSATRRIIEEDASAGPAGKALLVHGDKDQFSSTSDYQRYADKIAARNENGRLKVVIVEDGDHFFSSRDTSEAVKNAIDEWL
jgi:alpha/beta superfamily hydrolase